MVIARNCLDHCENPFLAFDNMLNVCKKGGYVWVQVYQNEANTLNYLGLHQWNFDLVNDVPVVWRPKTIKFLNEKLTSGNTKVQINKGSPHNSIIFTVKL